MTHFIPKINWELELNTTIEDEMWLNICASCHKCISSQIWKEFDCWKMKIIFFKSSNQICDCRFTVEIEQILFGYLSICIYLLLFFPVLIFK